MHPNSLLIAARVMLRHPCTRGQATASRLLARAAQNAARAGLGKLGFVTEPRAPR